MQFNHTSAALSAAFDDANIVSAAGLVPVMRLAERAGLTHLAAKHLTVPSDKGANAGVKSFFVVYRIFGDPSGFSGGEGRGIGSVHPLGISV